MNFTDAIRSAFKNYAQFNGRSSRSEYWYFVLFSILLYGVLYGILRSDVLGGIASLVLLIPGWAVSFRRLHDTDRSGWWALIAFIPVIGTILLIVWMATKGNAGANRFGESPLGYPAITAPTL